MKAFYPQTGTVEEWNAAYYRLEDYLRAHRVTNKLHQSQIIVRLLQRAAAQHALDPRQAPIELALAETYSVIDRWFQRLLPDEPEQRASVIGRVSLYIMDATERWPNVFLAEDGEIPPEFKVALRECSVQSGPDLRISSMVPRPLDSGPAEELVPEVWERLGKLTVALLLCCLALLMGAVVFSFTK